MSFMHTTLYVKDMAESLKFYEEIVGLPVSRKNDMGPDRQIIFLGDGETKVELIYDAARTDVDLGKDISIGFSVSSMDEKLAFIKEKGVAVHSGPFSPNPHVKFFFVLDPNGLSVQFLEGH